jgi:transcriptional repressor NrdR
VSYFPCPYCGEESNVARDTRRSRDGVRRRRQCLGIGCGRRYSTYEEAAEVGPEVVKRDGRVERFVEGKLLASILRAGVRPELGVQLSRDIVAVLDGRITAADLGGMVIDALREVDPVSCLRYLSAQQHFVRAEQFLPEVKRLRTRKAGG